MAELTPTLTAKLEALPIKECCALGNDIVYVVRKRSYGSYLSDIEELYQVAKADFPHLQREAVTVVKYGGRHYKGTFGIEFRKLGPAHNSYRQVRQLEVTL